MGSRQMVLTQHGVLFLPSAKTSLLLPRASLQVLFFLSNIISQRSTDFNLVPECQLMISRGGPLALRSDAFDPCRLAELWCGGIDACRAKTGFRGVAGGVPDGTLPSSLPVLCYLRGCASPFIWFHATDWTGEGGLCERLVSVLRPHR